MTQNDTPKRLSPKQRAYVASLIAGQSQTAAAEACGISRATASRYMALPQVRAALAAEQDAITAETCRQLSAGYRAALGVLLRLMKDASPAVQLGAARCWLETRQKTIELHDLSERVAALEATAKG